MNPKEKKSAIYFSFVAILLSFLVYGNSFHNPFVFDDESFVVNNEMVHNLLPLSVYFSNSTMASGASHLFEEFGDCKPKNPVPKRRKKVPGL